MQGLDMEQLFIEKWKDAEYAQNMAAKFQNDLILAQRMTSKLQTKVLFAHRSGARAWKRALLAQQIAIKVHAMAKAPNPEACISVWVASAEKTHRLAQKALETSVSYIHKYEQRLTKWQTLSSKTRPLVDHWQGIAERCRDEAQIVANTINLREYAHAKPPEDMSRFAAIMGIELQ